mmetsp:Transcript_27334/g.75358  ORF Transcript_27334/g.75358 Transcript_27334/m.75358 type:complete len:340 (-) Transcript_27334:856-1875(-)
MTRFAGWSIVGKRYAPSGPVVRYKGACVLWPHSSSSSCAESFFNCRIVVSNSQSLFVRLAPIAHSTLVHLGWCKIRVLRFGFFQRPSIVTRLPRSNVLDPIVNPVAKCLHRQNGKWLFQLGPQLFNTKQHDGHDCHGWDQSDTVPSKAKCIIQRKGQQQEPNRQKSCQVSCIKDGNGRRQESLATAQIILQLRNGSVNLIATQKVHGQIFHGIAQILQGPEGSVIGFQHHLRLLGRQSLGNFATKQLFIFPVRRQVSLHAPGKGPRAQCHVIDIFLSFLGRHARGGIVVAIGESDQIARPINGAAPIFARLVPSSVRRVGTKHQQESQRRTGQGEGRQR